ncbi:MAG: type II secretion system protein [Phycisphaera sp.]|nr:type II secretion system protein [Phycisphaera sp.]
MTPIKSTFTHVTAGQHRPRAFTLIELVMVIVIMAIMAVVAIPRFASASNRYRVDAAVQQILADVNMTAAVANRASTSRTISFDPDNDSYTLVGQASPSDPAQDWVIDLSVEPFGVNLARVTFGADDDLPISGYGLLQESGELTVTAGRTARRLIFTQGSTSATIEDLSLTEPTDDDTVTVSNTNSTRKAAVGGAASAMADTP